MLINSHCTPSIFDITDKNSKYCLQMFTYCKMFVLHFDRKIGILKYQELNFEFIKTICYAILNNIAVWLKCLLFPLLAVNYEKIFLLGYSSNKRHNYNENGFDTVLYRVKIRHQNYGKYLMIIERFLCALNVFTRWTIVYSRLLI